MDLVVRTLQAALSSSSSSSDDAVGSSSSNNKAALIRLALAQFDRVPLLHAPQQHSASLLHTPESSALLPSIPPPPPPPPVVVIAARPSPPPPASSSLSLNASAFKAASAAAGGGNRNGQFRYDNDDDGGEDNDRNINKRFQPAGTSPSPSSAPSFTTAKTRFLGQQHFNNNDASSSYPQQQQPPPPIDEQPSVGPRTFRPPLMRPPASINNNNNKNNNNNNNRPNTSTSRPGGGGAFNVKNSIQRHGNGDAPAAEDATAVHPRLKGIDPELVERIENDILESGETVTFDDIAGLDFAKQCIEELVVWPMRNPELYTGLRQMPRGVLLFGPPGNGKTIIGKAIAHECGATFFSISASSLTSKWIGEGEKMVRALFAVAAVRQPSVVFIDEIDSLLTQRSADENEASRRIKTEFLVQFDGTSTKQSDLVLVIGATNRPQELDEAARRRFVRRLYIPLPDKATRAQLLGHLLTKNEHTLAAEEIADLGQLTEGYSGADTTNLAREASMGPLREVMRSKASNKPPLRAITRKDFDVALRSVKASVSAKDLAEFERWNEEFGTQQLAALED